MGMFNYLIYDGICPICGIKSKMTAEFRFGILNLDTYHIGDTLQTDVVKCQDKGYVECDNCHKDFWINIEVENGILSNVSVCKDTKGYIQ